MAYLEEEDRFKIMVTQLLVQRAIELKQDWDEELSIRIGNRVGKAING